MRDGRSVDAKAKTKFLVNAEDWSSAKGGPKHTRNEDLLRLAKSLSDLRSTILGKYNEAAGKETMVVQCGP
jgi:hypothetical protein